MNTGPTIFLLKGFSTSSSNCGCGSSSLSLETKDDRTPRRFRLRSQRAPSGKLCVFLTKGDFRATPRRSIYTYEDFFCWMAGELWRPTARRSSRHLGGLAMVALSRSVCVEGQRQCCGTEKLFYEESSGCSLLSRGRFVRRWMSFAKLRHLPRGCTRFLLREGAAQARKFCLPAECSGKALPSSSRARAVSRSRPERDSWGYPKV